MVSTVQMVVAHLLTNAALSGLPLPPFAVMAPQGMVTGTVLLEARTSDKDIAWVKWIVGDWAKTVGPPFTFSLDVGAVPQERRLRVVALDKDRRPRYQQDAVVNRGGRGLQLTFVSPVAGASVSGPTRVALRADSHRLDPIESVAVELDGKSTPLEKGDGLYETVMELPSASVAIVARAKTRAGREVELPLVLNTAGFTAESDVCVVEQLVGVYRKDQPVENLKAGDFTIRDDKGVCDVRHVDFVRDAPLAIGFAIDASVSLSHGRPMLKAAAEQFIDRCFHRGDSGFVTSFGPVVTHVLDWSADPDAVKGAFQALPEWEVAGTQLHEAIVDAVYRFQGSQGARALLLMTDGYDYDGDITENDALAYARQSGVKIYALALPARQPRPAPQAGTVDQPPNIEALERFTSATGGRTYAIKNPEELPAIFASIERDLRSQYLVSFVSRARQSNSFHPVTVKASHGAVQTAAGFFY